MSSITTLKPKRQPIPATGDGLRPHQAAEVANVSVGTIYNWLPLLKTWTVTRAGRARGLRYISRASLESLVKSMTREGI